MEKEKFFKYVAYMDLKYIGFKKSSMLTGTKPKDTVHHASRKMIRMLRDFPNVITDEEYKVKYRYVLDLDTRITINLFSNGNSEVSKGDKHIESEEKQEILKGFLNRFYHINLEDIIKEVMKFPATRDLPIKFKLSPKQTDEFLQIFQKKLQIGKALNKIVTVQYIKLLYNCAGINIEDIKKNIIEMFSFPGNQIFVDSDNLAQDKLSVSGPAEKTRKKINNKKNKFKQEILSKIKSSSNE